MNRKTKNPFLLLTLLLFTPHLFCYGAPEGIRTPDLRLRRPLLYPTELLAPKASNE